MTEPDVCLDLFIEWLNRAYERHFHVESAEEGAFVASDGETRLRGVVRPLLDATTDPGWLAARDALQERLAEAVPAAVALWAPAGADLPRDEPDASEWADAATQAAVRLGPRERSYVPFPIRLRLRKSADSGGVVSATGGLNPHWARFTERVTGTYDLDSTQLHRLPESEEHLERLIDTIVERAGALETGQTAEIETIDAWTIQRVAGERGATIIGIPSSEAAEMGLAVRRNMRRILAEVGPGLREAEAGLRAVLLCGYYPRMEQEGATTALRGYDPALYSGLDFVCLACDGLVKPLVKAPAAVLG